MVRGAGHYHVSPDRDLLRASRNALLRIDRRGSADDELLRAGSRCAHDDLLRADHVLLRADHFVLRTHDFVLRTGCGRCSDDNVLRSRHDRLLRSYHGVLCPHDCLLRFSYNCLLRRADLGLQSVSHFAAKSLAPGLVVHAETDRKSYRGTSALLVPWLFLGSLRVLVKVKLACLSIASALAKLDRTRFLVLDGRRLRLHFEYEEE